MLPIGSTPLDQLMKWSIQTSLGLFNVAHTQTMPKTWLPTRSLLSGAASMSLPGRHEDARAWIFGITRNILLNTHRGEQRRLALGVRLADAAALTYLDEDADPIVNRVDLGRAWRLLSEVHQEALGLVVFEDLNAPQAAAVLGISPVAFRLRLSRARRALRLLLEHLPQPSRTPAASLGRTTTP